MNQSDLSRVLVDLDLSRRLEWTEACSNIQFVEARAQLSPETDAEWVEIAGASVMFDGADSPCTQTFGLGMRAEPQESDLAKIEAFYRQRGAPVFHEVSPLADIGVHQMLCRRGYQPVEMTSVLFRELAGSLAERLSREPHGKLAVREVGRDELSNWARLSAAGWSEYAEYAGLMYELALVAATRHGSRSFVAEIEGQGVATAGLSIVDDVALLTGASTIVEARRQGAQRALLYERLAVAVDAGCRLAMMCALPGSTSQRNAEREGFRIAYTRIKWGLTSQ